MASSGSTVGDGVGDDGTTGVPGGGPRNPLTCGICHDYYNEPCLLSCFHTFCARCIHGPHIDGMIKCPICGQQMQLKDGAQLPPPDQLIRQLVELANSENPPCANCDKRDKSTMFFCTTCGQALCTHCREHTHRAKMFSSHEVVHMSKCAKDTQRRCPTHGEQYIMYSQSAKCMLCATCFRDTPADARVHCVDIESAWQQASKKMERAVNSICELQAGIRDGVLALKSQLDELRHSLESEKRALGAFCQGMQEAITKTHAYVLAELQRQFETKERMVRAQLLSLGSALPVLQMHLMLCTAFTSGATKYQFLELAHPMLERLSRVAQLGHPSRPPLLAAHIRTNYRADFARALQPYIGQAQITKTAAAAVESLYDQTPTGGHTGQSVESQMLQSSKTAQRLPSKSGTDGGPFSNHCRTFDTQLKELSQQLMAVKERLNELQHDVSVLKRANTPPLGTRYDHVARDCRLLEQQLEHHQIELERLRNVFDALWEEQVCRIHIEKEIFHSQMNDILSLRSEVKKLQALAQHLEPFVKSFSTGIGAGEVSLAAADAADNQHLQALLDHLARLQMQEPPHPQAQAPTKEHRHPRSTATSADNALYMKETKEIPTRCRTPSGGVGAVLDSSGNIVVYGTAKSTDPKRGVLSQLIEKARTQKEDRKKSPGREDGRDRSQSRRSRKSPDSAKPKTPPGHSSGSKMRSLYRSLKGSTGDTSAEGLDQAERCTDSQQPQSHIGDEGEYQRISEASSMGEAKKRVQAQVHAVPADEQIPAIPVSGKAAKIYPASDSEELFYAEGAKAANEARRRRRASCDSLSTTGSGNSRRSSIADGTARKKRQEEVEKMRLEEQQRKQQERELKRQQAVMLKEQMYMQELTKQREMLYTVELERERRRQHMALVRALENRRKMEEKEKKRLEARAERIATKEKRAEQRRVEMELIEQIRKPVEDMELTDHRSLPELKRIPGLKLSGQAFADIVMVFEFLHNFGETLGFDMESLPSLKSLQLALLNDEEAEEEMLSVMTHLLVCAIEDPGIPQPARHTTGLGQSLRQADITHANISEVLRIYLYANATGEVKALTGVCLERERDKKFADHHQNGGDYASTCSGKNAQFYEHLHNNETWRMSERLRDKPFLALNPTHKAQMLAFLCNELLQNKAVIRQIEGSLETVAQLRKERFVLDTKIRKLRQLHGRKIRMEAVGVIVNKIGDTITIEKKEGEEESNTTSTAVGTTPTPDEIHHEDEVEDMSENESEGTQPEEEEDKNLSGEELGKKLDKLLKQSEEQLQKLNSSSKQLRAHIFGQDRYWRRYWELASAGGIFVEAMESAEPEILELQAELDEKYKNMPMEEKPEEKPESESKNCENRENEAPNEVKDEKKHNSNEQDVDIKSHSGDKIKSEMDEITYKKESMQNCGSGNSEKVEEEKRNRNNDIDGTMTDAKTNVTSEEIKQETEVINMDISIKTEKIKKENEEMDEDMSKPLIKTMEDKIVETIPNGDKFNHINNLHNGKELNGSFISNSSNTEPNWFSILPRETCDTPGPSTKQIFGIAEPTELRIPVFPPPASPNYDRCDSPAPLILTQDEAAQLEYLKVHGLPPPGEAKPVSKDLRYGWWRIIDVDTFQELLEHLHSRGVREKELKRTTWATMESFLAVTGRINVDPGNIVATELQAEPDDPDTPIPKPDNPRDWGEQVALRVDAQLLEQVEALEDKVANASMQVKGWKLPPRAGTEEAEEIEKLNEMEKISAVEQARQRLLSLEAAIERRYLKPPLGVCTGDPNLAALKAEQAAAANANNSNNSEQNNQAPAPPEETTPRGLNTWREATARAHTSAQLAMALYMLEASIAWDKSIMKANCQFCHSGDNEDKLLLCDGCDRGYHTYCFRPKMENIPDGDWYCHECMNKATGERNCLVCGKRAGKNLVLCELCPRAYHTDCHNPVMPKMPRGKWYCSNCHSKQPKKRNSSRRSHTKGGGTRESESSDHPPASPTPSTASNTHVEDVSSSEPATPTASPRKEGNNRTLTKKQQRELAPCKILLEQLEQQDEAWPFLLPVNTKQFPTYKKIIKTPMDLSTIKKKLQDSAYKSRDEFCADVRQMFINCEVFNEDDSPVGKAGHGMRSFFEMRWTEITGAPPPHPQTHS